MHFCRFLFPAILLAMPAYGTEAEEFETVWKALREVKGFAKVLGKRSPLPKAEAGFHETGFGYLLHESCSTAFGGEVIQDLLHETLLTGAVCLLKLKTDTAKNHVSRLGVLLSDAATPPKLFCPKQERGSIHGRATTSTGQKDHPSIEISPSLLDGPAATLGDRKNEVRRTLFHEMIHNLGYRHGAHVEYPYACEACCFPDAFAPEGKKQTSACEVCRGEFKGTRDKDYLKKATEFVRHEPDAARWVSESLSTALRKGGIRDREIFRWWAEAQLSTPLRIGIALEFESRFDNLTQTEKDWIQTHKAMGKEAFFARHLPSAKVLARAYIQFLDRAEEDAEETLLNFPLPIATKKEDLKPGQVVVLEDYEQGMLLRAREGFAWLLYQHYEDELKKADDKIEIELLKQARTRIFTRFLRRVTPPQK